MHLICPAVLITPAYRLNKHARCRLPAWRLTLWAAPPLQASPTCTTLPSWARTPASAAPPTLSSVSAAGTTRRLYSRRPARAPAASAVCCVLSARKTTGQRPGQSHPPPPVRAAFVPLGPQKQLDMFFYTVEQCRAGREKECRDALKPTPLPNHGDGNMHKGGRMAGRQGRGSSVAFGAWAVQLGAARAVESEWRGRSSWVVLAVGPVQLQGQRAQALALLEEGRCPRSKAASST